jgi:hypothetical protein
VHIHESTAKVFQLAKVSDVRIALDFGTSMTRLKILHSSKEQTVPTLIALAEDQKTILGIGEEAERADGKSRKPVSYLSTDQRRCFERKHSGDSFSSLCISSATQVFVDFQTNCFGQRSY